MSFRLKVLLSVLLLTLVAFDGSALLLMQRNNALNLERERARALGEHHQLLQDAHSQLDGAPIEQSLPIAHNRLVAQNAGSGMMLFWYDGQQPFVVDSPIPESISQQLLRYDGQRRTMVASIKGGRYLLVSSELQAPHDGYALISASTLMPLQRMNAELVRTMTLSSAIISGILMVLVLCLLHHLLRPVDALGAAMRRTQHGEYGITVDVRGQDEIAHLAHGFNRMSDTVERQIQSLHDMAEQKQRFADNLAHEMRTPVTAISGYAKTLLDQPMDERDRRKALTYIAGESARLQRMSEALLQLSSARHIPIQVELIDIKSLFSYLAASLESELTSKSIRLHQQIELPNIYGDQVLLASLLINLLVNAVRASSENGEIALISKRLEGIPALCVSDVGRGMEQGEIDKVTEPFYRVDKARARQDGGAGLGLSLVRQIAECHGAKLTIDSSPKVGTTVSVSFTTALQPGEYLATGDGL